MREHNGLRVLRPSSAALVRRTIGYRRFGGVAVALARLNAPTEEISRSTKEQQVERIPASELKREKLKRMRPALLSHGGRPAKSA